MRWFFGTFLAAAMVLVVSNALFDPQGTVQRLVAGVQGSGAQEAILSLPGTGKLGVRAFERYIAETEPQLDLAVLGSSNAFSLSSASFKPALNARIFWIPGASLEDHSQTWAALIHRQRPPHFVVWFVDPYMFNSAGSGAGSAQGIGPRLGGEDAGFLAQASRLKERAFEFLSPVALEEWVDPWGPWLGKDAIPQRIGPSQVGSSGVAAYFFQGQVRAALAISRRTRTISPFKSS